MICPKCHHDIRLGGKPPCNCDSYKKPEEIVKSRDMNRTHKYRAWYKPDFDLGELIRFDQKEIDHELYFAHDDELKYLFHIPFMDEDWLLEQYTGVKDKNGKKIYEGDVVKYLDYQKREIVSPVFYEASYFGLLDFNNESAGANDLCCKESDVEIIGNIHENK